MARAFGAYELGAPKKFTQEQIFDSIKKEYQQRLQTNDIIKSDPNTLCDEYWKDEIQTWSNLILIMEYYILRVKAVDVEYIGKIQR